MQSANKAIPSFEVQFLYQHAVWSFLSDVHLMVKPVDRIIPDFAKAGANIISFHPEASEHIDRTIGLIKEQGCKAGLVFNPATPLHYLDHVLDKLDLVLIHWPVPGLDLYVETWKALIEMRDEGLMRSIGLPLRDPASRAKWCANSIASSARARSGGTSIGTTLMR